jgi:hypothetical protein
MFESYINHENGGREITAVDSSRSCWVSDSSPAALFALMLDDFCYVRRSAECPHLPYNRRRPLSAEIYKVIASFLRFDAPLPNMLYAFGGRDGKGPLDTAEMLDTWHGVWTACPPMPTRRAGCAAAVLPNGCFIISGGYDRRGIVKGILASCDVYDPHLSCWRVDEARPLTRARWGHGCASLRGKVHVIGGCALRPHSPPAAANMETANCCEVYDPEVDSWVSSCPLQMARAGVRVVSIQDRYLVAVGGCSDVFGDAMATATVELYDGCTGHWHLLDTHLAKATTTPAAVALDGCQILVMGGAPAMSRAEMYSVSLPCDEKHVQPTETIASLPDDRMGCQAAVIRLPAPGATYPHSVRRSVIVIGGESNHDTQAHGSAKNQAQLSSALVFDVETGAWRSDMPVPALPKPRTAVALCVGVGRVAPISMS